MSVTYEKRILRVLKYISENPAGDLSLDTLADVAAMSRFHWHRVFQAMTGETCAQAVRRVRLYQAARWLIHDKRSISQTAVSAGYPHVQSFSRAFSEDFGVSPGVFRKTGKLALPSRRTPKGKLKMFDVDIENAPTRRLAALLHTGPYTKVGPCFEKLIASASSLDLWPHIHALAAVHYDDPNVVAEADLRCHAGLVIPTSLEMPEGLEEVILSGGRHAIMHYKGPYTSIKVAYDYLFGGWLPNSGREPADGPCYELYLNSPQEVSPEELLTDILLPLK